MTSALTAINRFVNRVAHLREQKFFNATVQELVSLCRAQQAVVACVNTDKTKLVTQAVYSKGKILANFSYRIQDAPCANTLSQGFCVIKQGLQHQFPLANQLRQWQAKAYMGVCIQSQEGEPLGVCMLTFEQGIEPDWRRELLTSLKGLLAKELEQNSGASFLKDAPSIGRIGSWEVDLADMAVQWSEGAYLLFDLEPYSQIMTLDKLAKYIVPGDRKKMQAKLKQLAQGQIASPYSFYYRIISARGIPKWLNANVSVIKDNQGRIVKLSGITQDVTRQKVMQRRGEEKDKLLETIVNSFPVSLMRLEVDGSISWINPCGRKLLGYGELDKLNVRQITYPEDGLKTRSQYKDLLKGVEDSFSVNKRYLTKTGDLVLANANVTAVRNQKGDTEYFIVMLQPSKAEEKPRVITGVDLLTQLPNRRSFHLELNTRVRLGPEKKFALLHLNLDDFKSVNNNLDHLSGDQLLKRVAGRLKTRLRKQDYLARLGGDEFSFIIPDIVSKRQAEVFAKQILGAFSQGFRLENQQLYISACMGITLFPADANCSENLMQNADQALFAAKKSGRNQRVCYQSEMARTAQRQHELRVDLAEAIKEKNLTVFYQPIIENLSGKTTKLEALVRWQHPIHGFISPDVFVPLAEESGLIQQLGELVLEQACFEVNQLHKEGFTHIEVSVNRSTLEFQTVDLLASEWIEVIKRSGLRPNAVTMEITESLMMSNGSRHIQRLEALKKAGINIAIDDFGTGYSSLNYLRSLPADLVKIDRSFISNIPVNQQDNMLLNGIIDIIHNLGMKVVTEGVEHPEQLAYLQQQGCDFFQGFLLSRPLPFESLREFLQQQRPRLV